MFHLLVAFFVDICRKTFRVTVAAYVALNRWMAFLAHLTMMFFIWNFLLFVIGVVSTVQMAIGFGFDVIRVTSSKSTSNDSDLSLTDNNNSNVGGEKRRSAINEYWHNRRKGYQQMVDELYVKYMNRLVGVQQQQQQFFSERQYFNRMDGFPQEGDPYLLGQQANAHMFMEGHYPDTVNAVGKPEAFVADEYRAVPPSSSSSLSSSPSNSTPPEPYPSTVVESPLDLRNDLAPQIPATETAIHSVS